MYNGWANYPTWTLHLWLTNEPGSYRGWLAQAREAMGETGGNVPLAAAFLADSIQTQTEENNPLDAPGAYTDILTWALGEVDYREIARWFIETAAGGEIEGDSEEV